MAKKGWSGLVVGVDWCRFSKEQTGIIVSENGNMCETSDNNVSIVNIECDAFDDVEERSCVIIFKQKGSNLSKDTIVYQGAGATVTWTVDSNYEFDYCKTRTEMLNEIMLCKKVNNGACEYIGINNGNGQFKVRNWAALDNYDGRDKDDWLNDKEYKLNVEIASTNTIVSVKIIRKKANNVTESIKCEQCNIDIDNGSGMYYETRFLGTVSEGSDDTYSIITSQTATCVGQMVNFTYKVTPGDGGKRDYDKYEITFKDGFATIDKTLKTIYVINCGSSTKFEKDGPLKTVNTGLKTTVSVKEPFELVDEKDNVYTVRVRTDKIDKDSPKVQFSVMAEDTEGCDVCNTITKDVTINLS